MALATLPRSGQPGLSARMSSLCSALGAVVADLDPGLLLGSDAVSLYGDCCRLERLVTAAKTLLAPRIEEAGSWEADGHRSAAGLLATLEGGTTGPGPAHVGERDGRLVDLPGTEAALRQGSLSGSKLSEVTQAGSFDPDSEARCWPGSIPSPSRSSRSGASGSGPPRPERTRWRPCPGSTPPVHSRLVERRRGGVLFRGSGHPRAGGGPDGPTGPGGQPPAAVTGGRQQPRRPGMSRRDPPPPHPSPTPPCGPMPCSCWSPGGGPAPPGASTASTGPHSKPASSPRATPTGRGRPQGSNGTTGPTRSTVARGSTDGPRLHRSARHARPARPARPWSASPTPLAPPISTISTWAGPRTW